MRKKVVSIIILIILMSISLTVFAVEDTTGGWEDHNVALSFNYRDISVSDNGTYVIVGDGGNILYSKDTLNWESSKSNTRETLFGCTWGNNTYVAVGADGSIIHSKDGIQWELSFKDSKVLFEDVVYGGNGFVAIGAYYPLKGRDDTRYIYYSKDGISWEQSLIYTGDFSWGKVSYINNIYIAYNNYSDDIAYSKNGLNWTIIEATVPINNSGLIWDGYKYISIGTELNSEIVDGKYVLEEVPLIYTSTNLTDWVKIEHNINDGVFLQDIIQFSGYYYMTCSIDGGSIILRSLELKNWEVYTQELISNLCNSAIYNNLLTFVGSNGTVVNTTNTDWKQTESYNSYILQIVYNGKFFIAIGNDGRFYRSEDGATWIQYSSGIDSVVSGIVWTGDQYIALRQVFDGSKQVYTGLEIYSSSDGIKWSLESKIDDKNFVSLHYCNSKYFILGQKGEIYYSTDAKVWSEADSTTDNWLKDIECFNNHYYAVGMFGTLLDSADGIVWKSSKLGSGNDLNDIATNGKSMLVVGDFAGAYYTTDAKNWTKPQAYSVVNYEKTLWDGNQYVIFTYNGVYYKTKDGKNFNKFTTDMYKDVSAVCWNGEKYIVVGVNGEISTQIPNDFIKVIIDSKPVIFDVSPQIINNRTMIPARAVFERIGATVSWDNSTSSVIIAKDDITIVLKIGSPIATVNGIEKPLDSPAVIIDGRTLAPARFIAEELGMKVDYDNESKTVLIE